MLNKKSLKLLIVSTFMIVSYNANAISLDDLSGRPKVKKEIIDYNFKVDKSYPMIYNLNKIRSAFGFKPLEENESLTAAAMNHAYYMTSEENVSHYQSEKNKKFTGKDPLERALYTGYDEGQTYVKVSEVVSMYNGKQNYHDLDNFLVAIYHRFSILEPGFTDYGEVRLTDNYKNIAEMKLGSTKENHPLKYIFYPLNNQINVPTYFYPSQEVPNPMPKYKKVGYPISFQITSGSNLNIENFQMTDRNGNDIKGKILNNKTDKNVSKSQFAFIPFEELKNEEIYEIKLVGNVNGNNNFYKSWKFKTEEKKKPVIFSDKEYYNPGEKIRLEYNNIPDINVKMEFESIGSKNLLVDITSKENSWGYVEMTALNGCKIKSGCEVSFTLVYNNNQKIMKKFKVMP